MFPYGRPFSGSWHQSAFLEYSSGYDFGGHRLPSGRLWLTFEDSPALSSGLSDLVDTLERGGHCVCFDSVTAFNLS